MGSDGKSVLARIDLKLVRLTPIIITWHYPAPLPCTRCPPQHMAVDQRRGEGPAWVAVMTVGARNDDRAVGSLCSSM